MVKVPVTASPCKRPESTGHAQHLVVVRKNDAHMLNAAVGGPDIVLRCRPDQFAETAACLWHEVEIFGFTRPSYGPDSSSGTERSVPSKPLPAQH